MTDKRHILGVLDWGIGGLGVVKAMRRHGIKVPIIYWSDSGVAPYGKMSRAELAARVSHVVRELVSRGATHVLIACNAASTVVDEVRRVYPHVPITGMIEHAARTLSPGFRGQLAVLGGRRTILSKAYSRAFEKTGIKLRQRIAQPLSAHIERGDLASDQFNEDLTQIFTPIRRHTHVLLACTHYPAAMHILERRFPNTTFIDPAETVARWIKRNWTTRGLHGGRESMTVITTGSRVELKRSAREVWGIDAFE